MRVVQVNAVNEWGSTGRTVAELDAGLRCRGIESRVAHSAGPATSDSYVVGSPYEKKIHALESRITGRQAYFSTRGTRAFIKYLASQSPDVVHLRNLHGNFINLPMLLSFLGENDIPTVLSLHDCWFYTGKCCHYTADGCMRWQLRCGECPRLHKDNPSWFVDASARMLADKRRLFAAIPRLAVVGVSDWITDEVSRSILANAAIVRRVYNWVDLRTFQPHRAGDLRRRLGLEDVFVTIAVATRWTSEKGLEDVLRLADMMKSLAWGKSKKHGDRTPGVRGTQLVLIGRVDKNVRIPDGVNAVGPVEDAFELARYYAEFDALVQLSKQEAFGKVVAEAFACGMPVVGYRTTATAELVDESRGCLVDVGDLNGVVAGLGEVASRTRRHYSAGCRAYAEDNFDKDALIDQHIELYRQLSGSSPGW